MTHQPKSPTSPNAAPSAMRSDCLTDTNICKSPSRCSYPDCQQDAPASDAGLREALNEAYEFIECDTLRSGEIGEYAKRVCKQIKEALAQQPSPAADGDEKDVENCFRWPPTRDDCAKGRQAFRRILARQPAQPSGAAPGLEKQEREKASEIAHRFGRKTYGAGGNKIRDICHQIGVEIDPSVKW